MLIFGEMKFDLELIYDDPFESNAFNILVWTESKVKDNCYLDAAKEIQ